MRRFDGPGEIDFVCSDPELETDDNLVVRAYRAFAAATGYAPRLEVHLAKHIPHGAGLGGGSSDAAVMLRYLNDRAGEAALSPVDLAALALTCSEDGFWLSARLLFAAHIPIMLAEGLVTALAMGFMLKVRPEVFGLRAAGEV